MTPGPGIAVVIPTYNRRRYLGRAVGSALAQTRQPDQVIVVDDGSTDDTLELLARFDRRERLEVVSLPHSGLPGLVRNAGLARVQTSHVAFLDSDDEWLPQKLELQARIIAANPRALVVCGNATKVASDGAPHGLYFETQRHWPPAVLDERTATRANPVITSTALAPVDAVRRLGGFPTERRLFAVEDFHLWSRLLCEGSGIYSPEPVALYRVHSEGASRDRCDNAVRRLFVVRSLSRSSNARSRGRWRVALARQYAECAGWYQGMGRPSRARYLLVRARQLAGLAPMTWARAVRGYLWAFKTARHDHG